MSTQDRERPGWDVIEAATAAATERLGDRLASAYAIGSLAHGGFAPAVSDVDLALLTGEPVDDMALIGHEGPDEVDEWASIEEKVQDEVAGPWDLGPRLSVFHAPWGEFSDPPAGARFPPI